MRYVARRASVRVGIAFLSDTNYLWAMKVVSIKLPEATLRRLKAEAQATGRTVASLVRERVDPPTDGVSRTVHDLADDLAGSVSGSRRPATNARRKFRRS